MMRPNSQPSSILKFIWSRYQGRALIRTTTLKILIEKTEGIHMTVVEK